MANASLTCIARTPFLGPTSRRAAVSDSETRTPQHSLAAGGLERPGDMTSFWHNGSNTIITFDGKSVDVCVHILPRIYTVFFTVKHMEYEYD